MKNIAIGPVAQWAMKLIIEHFEDGLERIKEGRESDVYVERIGTIYIRIAWRDNTRPADCDIFTDNGVEINEHGILVKEPASSFYARNVNGHTPSSARKVIELESFPDLVIRASGYASKTSESEYNFAPQRTESFLKFYREQKEAKR